MGMLGLDSGVWECKEQSCRDLEDMMSRGIVGVGYPVKCGWII